MGPLHFSGWSVARTWNPTTLQTVPRAQAYPAIGRFGARLPSRLCASPWCSEYM